MDFVWDFEFTAEIIPDLVEGMLVVVRATASAIPIALILGLFLALGRRSENRWLSLPAAAFVEFIRSTPLLIQLFFLFFALPSLAFLPDFARVLSPITALTIGLGIHYATYCSEAYRAGINSVPSGQWEAATAANLSTFNTWRHVILPQALPRTLPTLGNYASAMLKDAPVGAAIGVGGVLFVARALGTEKFRYVEPMLMAGALFLAVSIPVAMLVRLLERKTGYESA